MRAPPEPPTKDLVTSYGPPWECSAPAATAKPTARTLLRRQDLGALFKGFISFLHHLQGLGMRRIEFQGLIEIDQGFGVAFPSIVARPFLKKALGRQDRVYFRRGEAEREAGAVC